MREKTRFNSLLSDGGKLNLIYGTVAKRKKIKIKEQIGGKKMKIN